MKTTKLVVEIHTLVSFSTDKIHLKLKGQFVIDYRAKVFKLLHKLNSLVLYHHRLWDSL